MTEPKKSPVDREHFAETVVAELAELRRDPDAWGSYLAEAEATHVRLRGR